MRFCVSQLTAPDDGTASIKSALIKPTEAEGDWLYDAGATNSASGRSPANLAKAAKSAKCGGLETNGPRDNSGPDKFNAVRRFLREVRGNWRFHRAENRAKKVARERLAEGEELGSNGL